MGKLENNVGCILLNNTENQILFDCLGRGCTTIASAVVELYLALPDDSRWTKHACGVACLVKDNIKRSFFIRVYDIQEQRLLWEQELYMQFHYKCPRDYFHTFEAEWSQAGLNFASEDEARKFGEMIVSKLKLRHRRTVQRRKERQLQRGAADTPNRPRPVSAPVTVNMKQTTQNVKVAKTKPTKGGRRLSKGDISSPTDFRRVQHIGFDTDGNYDTNIVEPEMKRLLETVGITERDSDTIEFVYDFVGRNGGMHVIQEAMANMSKSTNPSGYRSGPPTRPHPVQPPSPFLSRSDQRPPPSPKQGPRVPPRQTPSPYRETPSPPPVQQGPLMPSVRQPLVPTYSPSSYPYTDRAQRDPTRPPASPLRPPSVAYKPSPVNTGPPYPQTAQAPYPYNPMAPIPVQHKQDQATPSSTFASGRPEKPPPPPPPKPMSLAQNPPQKDPVPPVPSPSVAYQAPPPPPSIPPLAPPPPPSVPPQAPPPPPSVPPMAPPPPPAPIPGNDALPEKSRPDFLNAIQNGITLNKVEVGTSNFKRRQSQGDGLVTPDASSNILDALSRALNKRKTFIQGPVSDDDEFDAEAYDIDWEEDDM
ncbi:actin nucleation-promoting factor WASL-like isoform X1 [Haliotis cracherodii]|uniref:actin nucleation-promoting factor WASL-like isoform X1 n=1 Tax=Haliotis cracherodii TaxID=6455 RepID=UPI0039E85FD8